jgi:hypothetical protein
MAESLRVVTAVATAGIVVRPWTPQTKLVWRHNAQSPAWIPTQGYPRGYVPPRGPFAFTDVTEVIDQATNHTEYRYNRKTQPEARVPAHECYLIRPMWSEVSPLLATIDADLDNENDMILSYRLPHLTAVSVRLSTAGGMVTVPPETPVVVSASMHNKENVHVMSARSPVPRFFRPKTLYLFCVPVDEDLYRGEAV